MGLKRYTMEFRSHQCGQCKHETGISIHPVEDILGQWVRFSDVQYTLEPPLSEQKICTCKPPEFGPRSVTASAADWQCPIHGGLMQNSGEKHD